MIQSSKSEISNRYSSSLIRSKLDEVRTLDDTTDKVFVKETH